MTDTINIFKILEDFLSSDSAVQQPSHVWLMHAEFQVVLLELLNALENAAHVDVRTLAAVLLKVRIDIARRAAEDQGASPSDEGSLLGESALFVRDSVGPRVLARMANEPDHTVRSRLSGTVALIAGFCYREGEEWAALWELISQYLSRRTPERPNAPDDVACRTVALLLLNRLAEAPATLALLEQHVPIFKHCLSQSLGPTALFEEQCAAFEVISAIDQGISSTNMETALVAKVLRSKTKQPSQFIALKKMLRTFVPSMLVSIDQVLNCPEPDSKEKDLRSLLNVVADITDADPLFWFESMSEVFSSMSRIVLDANLEFHLRQSALRVTTRAASRALRRLSAGVSPTMGKLGPLVKQAAIIAGGVSQIVQKLLGQATQFVETDEEWMNRREDGPIDPFDVEDILEALCFLMGGYLHDAASPIADSTVLSMSLGLIERQESIPVVIGLRLLSQLINERPDTVEPHAQTILVQISTCYRPDGSTRVSSDIRCRWWLLKVLSELFETYGPSLQLSRPTESLSCLTTAIVKDPNFRCKCRAMTALYTFISPLEDSSDDNDNSSTSSLQLLQQGFAQTIPRDIIVPAIQSRHEEMQELGFALATVLAGVAGEAFTQFYTDFMGAAVQVLKNSIEVRKSGPLGGDVKKEFYLCEAAIGLASKLVSAVGADRSRQDFHFLCDAFIGIMVDLIARSSTPEDTSLALTSVLKGLTVLAETFGGDSFAPYLPQYAACIFHFLNQSDHAHFLSDTQDIGQGASTLGAKGACELLGKLAISNGRAECKEEGGVTRLCLKGKGGENQVIEIRTQIIIEKIASLESLVEILPLVGKHFVPYIPQVLSILKNEVASNYPLVRKPALEAASALLSCLLPSASEATTSRIESKCALATGVISIEDFLHLSFDLMTHLLKLMNRTEIPRIREAAAIIPIVEEISDSIHEANYFYPISKQQGDKAMTDFIQLVFQEFGKQMIVTMEQDIVGQREPQCTMDQQGVTALDDQDWSDEESSNGESQEEEDFEGTIYSGIVRSFGKLIQVFDRDVCTQLFMTHLNTPFSGLLTLPEANMNGRAAALLAFGILLESGDPTIWPQIALDIIPVVLLYGRCNDLPLPLLQMLQSGISIEHQDVYEDDVDRVQAAAYCLGVIADSVPRVLIDNFNAAIHILQQIINHPQAGADGRRPATECAVGAYIKIYTAPELRHYVLNSDPLDQTVEQLMERWLPFHVDEDESRTMTDRLVTLVLQQRIPELTEKPAIRKQLARFLHDVSLAHIENPVLINKSTWTSGAVVEAQRLIAL